MSKVVLAFRFNSAAFEMTDARNSKCASGRTTLKPEAMILYNLIFLAAL